MKEENANNLISKIEPSQGVFTSNTNRGNEWLTFAKLVIDHIEHYTIPQYGDAPNDQLATTWCEADCILAMKKYINRATSNSRGNVEADRDLLKIAHYACVTYAKRIEERMRKER